MTRRLFKLLKTSARTALLLSAVALALPTHADALKRGDLPLVDGVTLIGVEEGQLKYRTAAGDRSAPLAEISELAIESVPAFATGLTAFKAGEMREAQRSFEGIWQDNRVDWIRHFAGYFLAQVYDARNEPVSAGQVYAKLASDKADLFFLSKPPTASLAQADEDQKKRITEEIMAVASTSDGERRVRLEAFLKLVAGEAATLPTETKPGDKTVVRRKDTAVIIPETVWKASERPNQPEGKWEALGLLADGKYQEAIEKITPWLSNPGELPAMLFVLGRAQLALADEKEDQDLYRDAGLTFMRIVIHFSQQGKTNDLVPVAQLEVAYIHKKIGRDDIYQRLLFGGDDGGGVNLVIDDKKVYPYYRLRYYQIIGEKPPEDEKPGNE